MGIIHITHNGNGLHLVRLFSEKASVILEDIPFFGDPLTHLLRSALQDQDPAIGRKDTVESTAFFHRTGPHIVDQPRIPRAETVIERHVEAGGRVSTTWSRHIRRRRHFLHPPPPFNIREPSRIILDPFNEKRGAILTPRPERRVAVRLDHHIIQGLPASDILSPSHQRRIRKSFGKKSHGSEIGSLEFGDRSGELTQFAVSPHFPDQDKCCKDNTNDRKGQRNCQRTVFFMGCHGRKKKPPKPPIPAVSGALS